MFWGSLETNCERLCYTVALGFQDISVMAWHRWFITECIDCDYKGQATLVFRLWPHPWVRLPHLGSGSDTGEFVHILSWWWWFEKVTTFSDSLHVLMNNSVLHGAFHNSVVVLICYLRGYSDLMSQITWKYHHWGDRPVKYQLCVCQFLCSAKESL